MSDDRSSFDAYLKSLFRQEAHVRRVEDLLDENARNLYREIERLREGYISLASLARHMAFEGVGCPKRLLTPDEDVAYYSVFRQCIRQAKIAVRAGTLTLREPYMLLPISVQHLQRWLDANDTAQSIDEMVDKRHIVRIDEARAWLTASGARIPAVLGESVARSHNAASSPKPAPQDIEPRDPEAQARSAPSSTETTWRQVRWREAIVSNWPDIVAAYGPSASARDIMRYLKSNDTTGCILPGGTSNELTWTTDDGTQRIVSRKTLANAVSALRVQGRLTT
ncbi:hypothetical protein KEH56_03495 [Burkholderia cenocepacia]|uniref:hypothetical protein n=1 Tax=Burkholderia cenocepacia TaxID=95486 RepID=UPI001BA68A79|nr:hypothetical protein [Burkholderia cenocepacia]QUN39968.1 hypothetical protein KEH56_03495 [Burkholderia cenocepacia]QUO23899.1 hypothetical protein KEH57_09915 [Burkholderia cenocepacia]QUO28130.1 hypothetical protein KEH57_30490 [Burkholderia cenocepacia]QUO28771.1 hypothetical protein KEH57_33960 [Burkholderia cenocepacia]